MKILLIEDDLENSQMVTDFLADEGFEVSAASDEEKGCAVFLQGSYDLVLLDIMMPKRSGMEVMQYIRTTSTIPIIIISAKDSDYDKSLGLRADAYIVQ